MSLSGAWSRHAPHGAVASRVSSGRCMMLRMRNGGDTAALPWPRAPSGARLEPDRPRDPRRGRLDPVPAAVVEPMVAWETAPEQTPSWSPVAQRLSAAPLPTPRGGNRWQGAAGRGLRRSPPSPGGASRGRTRPAPARPRPAAVPAVGAGQRPPPAPAAAGMAVPVPALISAATCDAAQPRVERHVPLARRHQTTEAE